MVEFEFLKSLVIIFGLSAAVVFILGKFRVPSLIGFLIAGALLGPYGLELIKDIHIVEILAEIGVVLLLFTIGLEFSLKKLLSLKKSIFLGGFLQVFITALAVFFLARSFGQDENTAIMMGVLIALSSTAIVLKLLLDRAEIDSPHGRVTMGILIFQDLCVVLFMLMIPVLAGAHRSLTEISLVLLKSLAIVSAVIISARWIVPRALQQIVHTRMRELFLISIIFICLGTAFLTYELGLSLALGAFIAGLVISESEYSYQAVSDILPFKDSFNGLFFISVGMLMDIQFFIANVLPVLIIVAAIIILKTFSSVLAVFLTGSNARVSLHSGLILAQAGEFSFVISGAALTAGLLKGDVYQYFLSSAIITMLFTPLLVALSPAVSTWAVSRGPFRRLQAMREDAGGTAGNGAREDHVIIIGYGPIGRTLSVVLKELEVPYVILELNSRTVAEMRMRGEPIYYGDATSREILHKLGIEKALVAAIAITDPSATGKIVMTIRKQNPGIYIVVRTRYLAEVDDLTAIGADDVIPSEFEASIETFSRILQFYHMPRKLIGRYADKFRKDHYKMFMRGDTPKRLFQDTLALMPDQDYESYIIEKGSPAEGASCEDLDIQGRAGILIAAVRRGNSIMNFLGPEFIFEEGDIILLIGDKSSLAETDRLFFKKH